MTDLLLINATEVPRHATCHMTSCLRSRNSRPGHRRRSTSFHAAAKILMGELDSRKRWGKIKQYAPRNPSETAEVNRRCRKWDGWWTRQSLGKAIRCFIYCLSLNLHEVEANYLGSGSKSAARYSGRIVNVNTSLLTNIGRGRRNELHPRWTLTVTE